MIFNKAISQITSIKNNSDGRMRYTYELIKPGIFKLKMQDIVSGKVRYLNFKLKKTPNKSIEMNFACDGFSFNFPLKKNIGQYTFNLNDFILLIKYGIKVDENSLNPALDLDVEF